MNTVWYIFYAHFLTGLENLYQLTRKRKYELRVDLQDFDGSSVSAHYSYFSIDSEAEGYRLNIRGFINGGAGEWEKGMQRSSQTHKGETSD